MIEAPVHKLTDSTPAPEHTPAKEREVWSTLFHTDDADSPNQAPSGNTDLTRPPEKTSPDPPRKKQNSSPSTPHEATSTRRRGETHRCQPPDEAHPHRLPPPTPPVAVQPAAQPAAGPRLPPSGHPHHQQPASPAVARPPATGRAQRPEPGQRVAAARATTREARQGTAAGEEWMASGEEQERRRSKRHCRSSRAKAQVRNKS